MAKRTTPADLEEQSSSINLSYDREAVTRSEPKSEDAYETYLEMMMGAYSIGVTAKIGEYTLTKVSTHGSDASMWRVKHTESGERVDSINSRAFRSASEMGEFFANGIGE